jgi:hypothetical protein
MADMTKGSGTVNADALHLRITCAKRLSWEDNLLLQ